MKVLASVSRLVLTRAGGRCEYCRMHQVLQGATFHIEHVVPRSKGGGSGAENLALACPACNLQKSDRIIGIDPDTAIAAAIYHPRQDVWTEHFKWNDLDIIGTTPEGRATVALLNLNSSSRKLIRSAERLFGLFSGEA